MKSISKPRFPFEIYTICQELSLEEYRKKGGMGNHPKSSQVGACSVRGILDSCPKHRRVPLVIDDAQTLCPEFRTESFEPTYRLQAVKANSAGLAPRDKVIQACSKIKKTAKENQEESKIDARKMLSYCRFHENCTYNCSAEGCLED